MCAAKPIQKARIVSGYRKGHWFPLDSVVELVSVGQNAVTARGTTVHPQGGTVQRNLQAIDKAHYELLP